MHNYENPYIQYIFLEQIAGEQREEVQKQPHSLNNNTDHTQDLLHCMALYIKQRTAHMESCHHIGICTNTATHLANGCMESVQKLFIVRRRIICCLCRFNVRKASSFSFCVDRDAVSPISRNVSMENGTTQYFCLVRRCYFSVYLFFSYLS